MTWSGASLIPGSLPLHFLHTTIMGDFGHCSEPNVATAKVEHPRTADIVINLIRGIEGNCAKWLVLNWNVLYGYN